MMTPVDLDTIRGSALFAGLPEALQDRLLSKAQLDILGAEQTIFLQDDPPDALFIVLEGWVKLCRVAPSGAEAVVSVLGTGSLFGELSALHCEPYSVTAEAITPLRLLRMESALLRRLVATEPALASSMLGAALANLQRLVGHIEDLKARSGVQRVALFLLRLAEDCNGSREVELPYSKALIACELGMKPETLSRAFARLRDHGVRIEATAAHIEDSDRLHRLMAEESAGFWLR